MNQIKWIVPQDPILCGVDRKCEPFSILIPILLVDISHIHLERSRQCLHHSFGRSIGLGCIGHGSTLLFPYNLAESSEEIGHKSRFPIVPDSLASFKTSEHVSFLIFRNRLCCP